MPPPPVPPPGGCHPFHQARLGPIQCHQCPHHHQTDPQCHQVVDFQEECHHHQGPGCLHLLAWLLMVPGDLLHQAGVLLHHLVHHPLNHLCHQAHLLARHNMYLERKHFSSRIWST